MSASMLVISVSVPVIFASVPMISASVLVISASSVLTLPQQLLDYEVDSDDEWEEEEPGESISESEVG